MIDPTVFLGLPIPFGTTCKVYPPKVKDVVNNPRIMQLFKLLTYAQEEIEDLLTVTKKNDHGAPQKKMPTPLEFLLINCYQNKDFNSLINEAFQVFIHEPITLVYESKIILIGDIKDLGTTTDVKSFRYLSEENFFDFQNIVRGVMGVDLEERLDPNESPIVKRIKAARRRGKRLAQKSKSKKGISLTTSLGAICCMGVGLNPLNIGEISYASIDVIMTLYQQKEKYQTDIDSLMAGADPKKVHPKYWIREDNNSNETKV